MEQKKSRAAEIIRFALTGGVCFVVELAVLILLLVAVVPLEDAVDAFFYLVPDSTLHRVFGAVLQLVEDVLRLRGSADERQG